MWIKVAIRFAAIGIVAATATLVSAGDTEDCKNAKTLVKTDPSRAVSACRRLADKGDVSAQNNLGYMYYNGQGVPQDYAEATTWYRKAADQGYLDAQYRLGVMYYKGLGVTQDDTQAESWFRKAADQSNPQAQYALGFMYANGRGVPKDYVQSHMWFSLAASGGGTDAINSLNEVASKMTPEQIAEAQRLAREWKPKPEQP